MQIAVTSNIPQVQQKIAALRAEIRDKVVASAINKTIAQAKTQMVREITKEYKVSASYVRERLFVSRATAKSGGIGLSATLSGTGKRSANMIAFVEKFTTMAAVRRRKKAGTLEQLHFQIKKGGGSKVVRGAFIGNRGRTVFVRTTDKRLPIKALSTINVPSMFNQRRINQAVLEVINERFPVIFDRDARYFTDAFSKS